jgi:hypothetical protein
MQRPQISRRQRNVAAAITVGLGLGMFAFVASRPADAIDPAQLAIPDSVLIADSLRADSIATRARADSAAAAQQAGTTSQEQATSPDPTSSANTTAAPTADQGAGTSRRYRAGEDPEFATRMGWPVDVPDLLPGSILPAKRIVAYYGNPLSKRMGALGEFEKDEMLRRFENQLEEWRRADPATPVQGALHLIAVVAQGEAGVSGKYRTIMRDTLVEQVYRWAKEKDAILFIDIQVGHSDIRELLPRFDHFLNRPDVHLAIDPEFMMKTGHVPGAKIGTMDAADINYAADHLAKLVREHNLPPKVLVIHRFTRGMVTNSQSIRLRPEVQIVMHMDGWGAPWLKRDSYRDYVVREPVQYTGFKIFYHNDTKKGDPLMSPADMLRLEPKPLYIQYQ